MRSTVCLFIFVCQFVYAENIFTNEFEALVTTRVNYLELKDPHIFTDLGFLGGCSDITDTTPIGDGINPEINASIMSDNDQDGFLDVSLITRHNTDQPNYMVERATVAAFTEGQCTDPLTCSLTAGAAVTEFNTFSSPATCLDVEPGTTRPYEPMITTPIAPCYLTDAEDLALNLSGVSITLNEAQYSLRYQGGVTTDQGLIKGFLTEVTAESTLIPKDFPLIGGQTLASILPGHVDNCSTDSDMDVHPVLGDGWWMYFNTTSDLVTLNQ